MINNVPYIGLYLSKVAYKDKIVGY